MLGTALVVATSSLGWGSTGSTFDSPPFPFFFFPFCFSFFSLGFSG
jgi:hypothetical protein